MPSEPSIPIGESELEQLLDRERLPKHIGVIMDGNGRWAQARRLGRLQGHRAAVDSVRDIVETCASLGIEALTLYTFSVENWCRPSHEVHGLMLFLEEQLLKQTDELHANNVQLMAMGEIERLPQRVQTVLQKALDKTRANTGLHLNLALSYGGRQEIAQGIRAIAHEVEAGRLRPEEIDENCVSRHLYTSGLPELDLLIRTSGEMRISNFLLWQLAYAEIYFTPVLWPDFRRRDLLMALHAYQQRQRRFGGLGTSSCSGNAF